MKIQTIKRNDVTEIYITALPEPSLNGSAQNENLFGGIAETLRRHDACILQERIFVTEQALETAASVRTKIYGELDDGVSPTWLISEDATGSVVGVQVHAVAGCGAPDILKLGETPCGRVVRVGDLAYLTLSNIQQPTVSGGACQAQAMLAAADSVLCDAGVSFLAVPRTWMWLNDICAWYDDFNQARNTFFKKRGVIAGNGNFRMPASTGIGIQTENGSLCTMELTAVAGEQSVIDYLDTGGNQKSAFDYGSAFSRASKTRTPAGDTVYVSGTASIDTDGKTLYVGDAGAQIEATVANVRAVLNEFGYGDDDIVHAIAYCKTPEVRKIFADGQRDLGWPIIPVIADICRDDLLFEIEATAAVNTET